MTAKRIIILLALLILAAAGQAAAQDRQAVDLRARVVEVFGDKAIVESGGERLLVEPIAPDKAFPAAVGSEIGIAGQRMGNVLTPSRVTLPSGAIVQREAPRAPSAAAPSAPPPDAAPGDRSLAGQLAREGITMVGSPYRKRYYTEVAGRTADGRMVIASFDHSGRLQEIEDAEDRHIHPQSPEALPAPEVERRLAALGFTSIRLLDQRRYRFFFSVVDSRGDQLELHVDRAGNILKKVWLR
jgi:hypothetical protein